MTPRTVRVPLLVIGLLGVVSVAPGAGAWFADAAGSDGNGLSGAALDLKLTERGPTNGQDSTTDEGPTDAVADTWEDRAHDSLGADNVSNTLTVDNGASALSAGRVDLAVSYVENDTADGTAGNGVNTSKSIAVTAFTYNGTDLTGELADANGDGELDVDDLTRDANADVLAGRAGIGAGGSANLTAAFSGTTDLIEGVGAGDGVDVTVSVTAANGFEDVDRSRNNTIQYG